MSPIPHALPRKEGLPWLRALTSVVRYDHTVSTVNKSPNRGTESLRAPLIKLEDRSTENPMEYPSVTTELPGPRSAELFARTDGALSGALTDHDEVPFVESRKRGWIIEDADGNTFADHVSAWGSTPLGANPPEVLAAVHAAQERYGMEISDYVHNEESVLLSERLAEIAPTGVTRSAFAVSGTLAVEAGVKLAREATGRPMILTFHGQYHGESTYLTAGASSDLAEVTTQSAQYVAGLVFAPYPNAFRAPFHWGPGPYDDTMFADFIEDWLLVHQVEPEQIAGVLIEPVLGEGGILIPSQAFWDRLMAMCRRWGWKLILDEVQTCMGRCGPMFACQRWDGLDPDILLLDEIFAVGDEDFQRQCMGTLKGFQDRGKTILFVSHSPPAVQTICHRACLLDHGRLMYDGDVDSAFTEYRRLTASPEDAVARPSSAGAAPGADPDFAWHRLATGGKWSEEGRWTYDFLRDAGLTPDQYVLEVGCGSLASASLLLRYMHRGHYWGFEKDMALYVAGVQVELPRAGVWAEWGHFLVNDEFDLSGSPHEFDIAIAPSFFRRLTLNRVGRCVAGVLRKLRPGGRFFAAFAENPDPADFDPIVAADGARTYSDREPFHYTYGMLAAIVESLGGTIERVDARSHPRGDSVVAIGRARPSVR